MAWQKILAELNRSKESFDLQIEQQSAQVRESRVGVFCAQGCCNCCTLAVNCSFPEALLIAQTLTPNQQQALKLKISPLREISLAAADLKQFLRQFRDQLNGCPWLEDVSGNCSIYPHRPFSCRALISTRNSSWCGVDFASLHPQEKEAFLSSLDPEMVAFPTHYLAAPQELGLEFESQTLIRMRESFGVSLAGNLLYLTWLEIEHQLSHIIPDGFAATRRFLEEKQLNLPFLLQLRGENR